MSPQERYWKSLYELICHGYLLQAHCQAAGTIDRRGKAILAVTSSASLGIWAVFKAYPLVWAGIIVATQIVTATSKFLPYSTRIKAAGACAHDFREIQNWAESKWCEMVDGELTDLQITKARTELQSKTARALKAHFPLDGLPSEAKLTDQATEQAGLYLVNNYGAQ